MAAIAANLPAQKDIRHILKIVRTVRVSVLILACGLNSAFALTGSVSRTGHSKPESVS
jgi:hypothetical protein